ncbi:alpha/beta hydrolase family esterase [Dankookia sp. GCM10030260]|uniref:extracellular catalytic domain type 1 short-chain-length polyhydroxyalkanoate depolymerase n=1 Tax=Dankookia sp. GCM10030260 TaxID=3273390 RepID=UPI003617B396
MLVYAPARLPPDAPLIVVLHGCQQDAAGFATNAGWLALARRLRCALVLPEQTAENNRGRCFNWHRPADARRGGGEAKSIRQMVSVAAKRYRSDRRRVFVVGLSAGGAMAVALLAAYPAVFAAGAAVAGMPVGTASTSAMALLRMYRADPYRSRGALAAAVQAALPARSTRSWPRLSIWQGGRDRMVNPANAEALAAQWTALHGFDASPTSETAPVPGILRRAWGKPTRPAVELWTLAAIGHGFPIDPRRADGECEGPWVVSAGLSAAHHIAAFWGIDRL